MSRQSHGKHDHGKHSDSQALRRFVKPEWLASVAIAAVITSGVGAAGSAQPDNEQPESTVATGNLVANGTFDDSSSGWHGNSATGFSEAVGHDGPALELRNVATTPRSVVLNDRDDSVASTIAGHSYRARALVLVHEPEQSVVLRLREWDHSDTNAEPRLVGQRLNHDWVTSTDWHSIEVEYTATTDGATLDLNVVAYHLGIGHRIDIDEVSLIDVTAAGGEEEPVGPVVKPRPTPEITRAPAPEPAPRPEPAPEQPAGDWQLVFSDEFSGNAVDRSKWTVFDRSTYGDGNNELACLMDRPQNVSVADGVLAITAQAEKPALRCGDGDSRFPQGRAYSSAFLDSRDKASFEYGRFEARVKTPNAYGHTKGLWPAFWLRPDDGGLGEIDIFEIIGTSPGDEDTSNRTTQSIHYDYVKTHPKQNQAYDLPTGDFADGFHTHAIEWEPGVLRWYVDGVLTFERTTETTPWLDQAFSGPFHMRLNMAIGGVWTGSPDAHTQLPAEFEVDYIRVYQHG